MAKGDGAYRFCDCGKWGITPPGFRETKLFMRCVCGRPAYLMHCDPDEAGYREKDKVELSFVNNTD